MIFWDASAIVPLLVAEESSEAARAVAAADPRQIVWWGSKLECASGIARRERDGSVSSAHAGLARARLQAMHAAWGEMPPTEEIRELACRLVQRHPVRAADALQLAAALTWAGGAGTGYRFACLDGRLSLAARAEGFTLAFPDVLAA